MRSLSKVLVPLMFAIPALAFAQSNGTLSRNQAREHLVQLEKAGYSPLVNDPLYPRRLQQAEATLSRQKAAEAAYGPEMEGAVSSGQ
ncbi:MULTISPECIES: DUF4148 domain-containing protein [unclassified Caballeronia]|uniref:DUF4148 domain-containing protein n=1 Tax=unclassified Caballeronia TaxID=2646786 RepID=UPI0020283C25|nr:MULTISPECIES: DUF4148 domain-containing protein [unclassified Caballeronia]